PLLPRQPESIGGRNECEYRYHPSCRYAAGDGGTAYGDSKKAGRSGGGVQGRVLMPLLLRKFRVCSAGFSPFFAPAAEPFAENGLKPALQTISRELLDWKRHYPQQD